MPAFILVSSALLVFAVTIQFLTLEYQPATLVALFWSLPVSQQIAWVIICFVPLSLIAVALLLYCRLLEKRKAADVLETRLRSVRLDVLGLEQDQKDSDQAAQYLHRSDPEGAITALQSRLTSTEQAIQFHQQRNQSDLIGCVEQIRQQQQEIRHKLGEVIGKRRSIESSILQLQSAQDDMEQTISVIKQDKDDDTLEERLQRLSAFVGTTNYRCEEIERSIPGLLELEEKFDALQTRVAPLDAKETGAIAVLKALSDVRNRLAATMARLEQHEGVSLAERLQQLAETKGELEEQVSSVLSQFSAIETIRKDITGLFAKVDQDKDGDTLDDRLQKLSEFIGTTNSRCEEIERSMPGLLEMEEKLDALQIRVAPLDEKDSGVIGVLKALSDARNRLAATIGRLEQHEGVSLAERLQQLAETKSELEERVSSVLSQFSAIETIHKDITGLFAKLSQAQRMPREFDAGGRIVSING